MVVFAIKVIWKKAVEMWIKIMQTEVKSNTTKEKRKSRIGLLNTFQIQPGHITNNELREWYLFNSTNEKRKFNTFRNWRATKSDAFEEYKKAYLDSNHKKVEWFKKDEAEETYDLNKLWANVMNYCFSLNSSVLIYDVLSKGEFHSMIKRSGEQQAIKLAKVIIQEHCDSLNKKISLSKNDWNKN